MKNLLKYTTQLVAGVCAIICIASCNKEIDNRSYPESVVSGQFLYNGQPVQIMGTANENDNMLQLTQTGPGQWNPGFIKMFAREDGSYTINTFDGDYNLVITPGRGPWVANTETLRFNLNSKKEGVNFNVTPYFWITDYKTTYTDSVFTASFNLNKVVPTANLEKTVIYFSNTSLVDNASKVIEREYNSVQAGANSISFDLKTLSKSDKANLAKTGLLFVRVGVKTQGARDLLFTKTVELKR